MELLEGEMEGKWSHPTHDHSLVLRESLQGCSNYDGGSVRVYCDGCKEPIPSSSSSSSSGAEGGRGAFYACPNSNCWYLLHKRCAELPPKIEHHSHPQHALTLSSPSLLVYRCDACHSDTDGFVYRCSDCDFNLHVRCASMALRIQDRVHENKKIHEHPLIPLEKEAQFLCDFCGREHKGKSYLCPTCGFWANQICASTTTTVVLHSHPHPLTRVRSFRYVGHMCKICNEEVKRACWVYCCSEECKYWIPECKYWVHVCCLPWEEVKNSNKDILPKQIEIPTDSKEDIIINYWPVLDEPAELITQLIKKLSLQGTHKKAIKIIRCKKDHPLIFVNEKIDDSKDDQLCDGCAQTISSLFYHCAQCNFSLHKWCAELPNELRHALHQEHPIRLLTHQEDMHCRSAYCEICNMLTNRFVFGCFTCHFYLDLKCASLPRLINHKGHDHNLVLRRVTNPDSCNACGADNFSYFFLCEACNFKLCIKCALHPFSVRHRYDKHPFALTYSPIKGQSDEYYCEICEEDINSKYWFYHCIKCDQSLHLKCIYPIEQDQIGNFWSSYFNLFCRFNKES